MPTTIRCRRRTSRSSTFLTPRRPNELSGLFFELRTAGDPFVAVASVRRIVHDASHAVSITEVTTQSQRIEQTISQERTFAFLGSCFAVLAMLIACVGLYGAMAYTVARRTGEIGIRMALGAQRPKIIWMVLREVLAMTTVGLLAGYGAARLTTQFRRIVPLRNESQRPTGGRGGHWNSARGRARRRICARLESIAHRSRGGPAQRISKADTLWVCVGAPRARVRCLHASGPLPTLLRPLL